jgi:hypothetical protein
MKRHHTATLRQAHSTKTTSQRRVQNGRAGGRRFLLIMLAFAAVLIMGWGQCARTRVSGARTANPSSRAPQAIGFCDSAAPAQAR